MRSEANTSSRGVRLFRVLDAAGEARNAGLEVDLGTSVEQEEEEEGAIEGGTAASA